MKPIQIMMDTELLRRLDADEQVRQEGRSAVLRGAIEEYLRRREARKISDAYQRAYAGEPALPDQWRGWTEEGVWPAE